MPDFLKNFQIDTWYKLLAYIGGASVLSALFLEVKAVTNRELLLLAIGLLLIGVGEWRNHVTEIYIKPPNAYTGPATQYTVSVRRPDIIGLSCDLVGLVALLVGLSSVATAPIQPNNAVTIPIITPSVGVSPVNTSTTVITATTPITTNVTVTATLIVTLP